MPIARRTPQPQRLRAAAAVRCHGGASSLLRLSHAGEAGRWPNGSALADWVQRAAAPLARQGR